MEATGSTKQIDEYFAKFFEPRIGSIIDDGEKACFIGDELTKFELVEARLAKWAAAGDGKPNPYSPPIDAFEVAIILTRLNARMAELQDRIKARIADAEAALSPSLENLENGTRKESV